MTGLYPLLTLTNTVVLFFASSSPSLFHSGQSTLSDSFFLSKFFFIFFFFCGLPVPLCSPVLAACLRGLPRTGIWTVPELHVHVQHACKGRMAMQTGTAGASNRATLVLHGRTSTWRAWGSLCNPKCPPPNCGECFSRCWSANLSVNLRRQIELCWYLSCSAPFSEREACDLQCFYSRRYPQHLGDPDPSPAATAADQLWVFRYTRSNGIGFVHSLGIAVQEIGGPSVVSTDTLHSALSGST